MVKMGRRVQGLQGALTACTAAVDARMRTPDGVHGVRADERVGGRLHKRLELHVQRRVQGPDVSGNSIPRELRAVLRR